MKFPFSFPDNGGTLDQVVSDNVAVILAFMGPQDDLLARTRQSLVLSDSIRLTRSVLGPEATYRDLLRTMKDLQCPEVLAFIERMRSSAPNAP